MIKAILTFISLAWCWGALIWHLSAEWSSNPQYSYGWAVPFLCAFFLWEVWKSLKSSPIAPRTVQRRSSIALLRSTFLLLAFSWPMLRLVQGAAPEWRVVSWGLALAVAGLTMLVVLELFGLSALKRAAFPICFFLVAVPWLRPAEALTVGKLTQANSAVALEVLNVLGIPVIRHGNVMEVGKGLVGIDEGCSGIRSFQATLMIALFLGQLYRLSLARRLLCIGAGISVALFFNIVRTTLLTAVAAHSGPEAVRSWHDPAGVIILLGCFFSLWVFSRALREKPSAEIYQTSTVEGSVLVAPRYSAFVGGVLGFILLSEVAVYGFYHAQDSRTSTGPRWVLAWPEDSLGFSVRPISEGTERVLQSDRALKAEWQDANGRTWQANYLIWNPGKVAGYLARRHTPEACLPALGYTLTEARPLRIAHTAGIYLPYQTYTFDHSGAPVHVLYCRSEEGMSAEDYVEERLTIRNILRAIWYGRGNRGQRVIELAVFGITDGRTADSILEQTLTSLIKLE